MKIPGPPARHVRLLAECVVRLPARDDIIFAGSFLPNQEYEYEIVFREESSGQFAPVTVAIEMVELADTSGDHTKLLAHITAKYMMLFRTSEVPGSSQAVLPSPDESGHSLSEQK